MCGLKIFIHKIIGSVHPEAHEHTNKEAPRGRQGNRRFVYTIIAVVVSEDLGGTKDIIGAQGDARKIRLLPIFKERS